MNYEREGSQSAEEFENSQIPATNNQPKETILQEGVESPVPNFENLQNFVLDAARLGLHLQIPQPAQQTDQKWANSIHILGTYLYADDSVLYADIGKKYGIKRERTRQIIKQTTESLYAIAPKELQEKYPFESFTFLKPKGLQYSIRRSREYGGIKGEVIQMVQDGASAQEILDSLGISSNLLNTFRKELKSKGLQVPLLNPLLQKEIRDKIHNLGTQADERQSILDMYQSHTAVKNSEIISIAMLVKQAGLKIGGRRAGLSDIIDELKENNIAARLIEETSRDYVMRYGIIAAVDARAALEVLKNAPSLEKYRKNPVTVLGKKVEKIPSTFLLQNSDEYIPVKELLGDEFATLRNKKLYTQLFKGSLPFSVFWYRKGYKIHFSDAHVAQTYLREKALDLLNK